MPSLDDYFDEIDSLRVVRVKELLEIKAELSGLRTVSSKAVVVLTYACWEGFYNECVGVYLEFLKSTNKRVRDVDWLLLLGALTPALESVRARNHTMESKLLFVETLKGLIDCTYTLVDPSVILARSNLDFGKLRQNFKLLNFDLTKFNPLRNRIDKELVGWRHGVAHGDTPDLSKLDIDKHIQLTNTLLMEISDRFQFGMLDRL